MWLRGGWRPGFRHRFGRYDAKFKQAITNRHVIWLHTGAAREVNIVTQLIRALENRLPNAKLVVSATSVAGMERLRRYLPADVGRIYFPLDRRSWVSRALSTLNPQAVILSEPDLWPNFLWRSRHRGTPVFLAPGRLSSSYRRRLSWFSRWFRPLISAIAGVAAETQADAERYVRAGCTPQAVRVVGNLNLDAANLEERRRLDVPKLFRQLGLAAEARVLVAGGTEPGEERIVAEVFRRLRTRFADLFLVLAPRQVQRSRQIGRELEGLRIRFVYRNEVMSHSQFGADELDCLLLNTPGELNLFYPHTVAILAGGTLAHAGRADLTEPATLGKAIVVGPYHRGVGEFGATLLKRGGAVMAGPAELEQTLALVLGDPAHCATLGRNARAVAEESLGAINRTVAMVVEQLDEELYVAPAGGGR